MIQALRMLVLIAAIWPLASHADEERDVRGPTPTRQAGHPGIKPPPPPPPLPPPPPPSLKAEDVGGDRNHGTPWAGAYAGVHGSIDWGTVGVTGVATGATATSARTSARAGLGGYAGYNIQPAQFVLGIEADADMVTPSWADSGTFLPSVGLIEFSTTSTARASLRMRAGIDVKDALVFVTGGAAFGQRRTSYMYPALALRESDQTWRAGWTAGLGLEYRLSKKWAGRIEYRYVDFGTANKDSGTIPSVRFRERQYDDAVLVGLTYSFR